MQSFNYVRNRQKMLN